MPAGRLSAGCIHNLVPGMDSGKLLRPLQVKWPRLPSSIDLDTYNKEFESVGMAHYESMTPTLTIDRSHRPARWHRGAL